MVGPFTLMHAVVLVAGVALGLVAGYLAFPAIREARRLRVELDRTLQEHETYKASVNSHFRKTAELVGEMTRSYAAVYDHLATGARSFGDDAGAAGRLPFEPLPGVLAAPVIETVPVETMPSSGWPTDVAIDDAAHSGDDVATDDASPASDRH